MEEREFRSPSRNLGSPMARSVTGALSNVMTGAITQNDEVYRLRKQLRTREADQLKEKALYEQKIQQLELQVKDLQMRMEQQKQMHDSVINCLTQSPGSSTQTHHYLHSTIFDEKSQLQVVNRLEVDIQRMKDTNQELIGYKNRAGDLQQAFDAAQIQIRELNLQIVEQQNESKGKEKILLSQIDQNNQNFQLEIKRFKLQLSTQETQTQQKLQQQLLEFEKVQSQMRQNFDSRVKTLDTNSSEQFEVFSHQQRKNLEAEMQNLQEDMIALQKMQIQLRNEKDQALSECLQYKQQVEVLSHDLEAKEEFQNRKVQAKIKLMIEELENLQQDLQKQKEITKKLRKEKDDLNDIQERLEVKIRQQNRDRLILEEENDSQKYKQCQASARRVEQFESEIKQLRDINEKLQHDLLSKDKKIISIGRELREKSSQMQLDQTRDLSQRSQSPLSTVAKHHYQDLASSRNNKSPLAQSLLLKQQPAFGSSGSKIAQHQHQRQQTREDNLREVKQVEYAQLRMCQKMVECSTQIECVFCYGLCETQNFYSHLVTDHQQSINQTSVPSMFQSESVQSQIFNLKNQQLQRTITATVIDRGSMVNASSIDSEETKFQMSIGTIDEPKVSAQNQQQYNTSNSFLGTVQRQNLTYNKQKNNVVSNNSSQVVIMTQTQQSRSPSAVSSLLEAHNVKTHQKTVETKTAPQNRTVKGVPPFSTSSNHSSVKKLDLRIPHQTTQKPGKELVDKYADLQELLQQLKSYDTQTGSQTERNEVKPQISNRYGNSQAKEASQKVTSTDQTLIVNLTNDQNSQNSSVQYLTRDRPQHHTNSSRSKQCRKKTLQNIESTNTSKPNFNDDDQLRIMREISNETCVDVTARLDDPQKPDDGVEQQVVCHRNSPKRYNNYFEQISVSHYENEQSQSQLQLQSDTPRQKAKYQARQFHQQLEIELRGKQVKKLEQLVDNEEMCCEDVNADVDFEYRTGNFPTDGDGNQELTEDAPIQRQVRQQQKFQFLSDTDEE